MTGKKVFDEGEVVVLPTENQERFDVHSGDARIAIIYQKKKTKEWCIYDLYTKEVVGSHLTFEIAERECERHYLTKIRREDLDPLDCLTVGKKIRELREKLGVTRSALSRAARTSIAGLSRIEDGDSAPGWHIARRIAKALGVTLNDLDFPSEEGRD
jgi:DNA-binding XRE family transcriptional regulator